MSTPYLNRELSWVEFNQRVLNEALRDDLPLLERVKFLAITASNLDEFFQVRIGGLMLMRRSGRKTPDASGLTPTRNLTALRQRILQMHAEQYKLLTGTLVPAMVKAGIHPLHPRDLTVEQIRPGHRHLRGLHFPAAHPARGRSGWRTAHRPRPPDHRRLPDASTRETAFHPLRAHSHPGSPRPSRAVTDRGRRHWRSCSSRIVVAHRAEMLFPGETVTATTGLPRHSQWRHRRAGRGRHRPRRRNGGCPHRPPLCRHRPTRTPRPMSPRDLVRVIKDVTAATPAGDLSGRRPAWPRLVHGSRVPARIRPPARCRLAGRRTPLRSPRAFRCSRPSPPNDVLLHHPYESFEPVLRLIEEAADDPDVIAIKQVLYRTARKSRIIDALIRPRKTASTSPCSSSSRPASTRPATSTAPTNSSAPAPRSSTASRASRPTPRSASIVRRESGHLRRYVHLGTGNYNETTARLYTDLSYLTCKPEYGNDASLFFNAVTGRSKLLRFQRLVPAPTAMKPHLARPHRQRGGARAARACPPASSPR